MAAPAGMVLLLAFVGGLGWPRAELRGESPLRRRNIGNRSRRLGGSDRRTICPLQEGMPGPDPSCLGGGASLYTVDAVYFGVSPTSATLPRFSALDSRRGAACSHPGAREQRSIHWGAEVQWWIFDLRRSEGALIESIVSEKRKLALGNWQQ